MWRRLDDRDLISTYRGGFFDSLAPEVIVGLLDALSGEPFAERVWAATSLNKRRLTTAPSWVAQMRHGAVWIISVENGVSVSYARPGSLVTSESLTCSDADALEVVRRFVHDFLGEKGTLF